jgi:hypothetical protein
VHVFILIKDPVWMCIIVTIQQLKCLLCVNFHIWTLSSWTTGVQFSAGAMMEFFSSPPLPYWLWVHPASCPRGTRDFYPGIKRPGRKADYSPPVSAEVKNAWSYTSTPQNVFTACCLVKHSDNCTFTFYLKIYSGNTVMRVYSSNVFIFWLKCVQ